MSQVTGPNVEIIVFPLQAVAARRESFYRLLSHDEKRRAAGFHFDRHRDRFIVGRGSIREILSANGGCRPTEIKFEVNAYGKPSIEQPAELRAMKFNATSSDNLGAIAIADDIPLGLDIEKIKPDQRGDYDLIARNHFSEAEYQWYRQHDRSEREQIFFDFWTCKEAYLKALGIGLSGELDGFTIDLQGSQPVVTRTSLAQDAASELCLFRLDIADGFSGTLAVSHPAPNIHLSSIV